jgi:coenzyme F420 hydrogenase subunit beta
MHGHMVDFKKRGGYLRNRMRKFFGYTVPDYGYRPSNIAFSRKITELVISLLFLLAGTRVSRAVVSVIPEKILGPIFNHLRIGWKNFSKPVKRKGLRNYDIIITNGTTAKSK